MICLALSGPGYLWVRPEEIRLVRTTDDRERHWIQLKDGLEYELFGGPRGTLKLLGVKYNA